MDIFLSANTWLSFLTLCFLEVVLGVDNVIFISIVSNKLPPAQRKRARNIGLLLALCVRIAFLSAISWIIHFTDPVFYLTDLIPDWLGGMIDRAAITADENVNGVSIHDLILLAGGLFLIGKSTVEINHEMESSGRSISPQKSRGMWGVVLQIILLDVIFSFDSILTAIGVANELLIMIMAIIFSIAVMILYAGSISRLIEKYPSLQVLALGFLILIGFMLFLEGLGHEIPKGYIYFAVAFSLLIEITNIQVRKKKSKHNPHTLTKDDE